MNHDEELRGMAFANFVADSILAKRLVNEAGFTMKIGSEVWDKDFGDEVVAYFDCGEATFERDGKKLYLYQSRFSDNWALDGPKGRTTLTASLANKEKLNDGRFVDTLLDELGY